MVRLISATKKDFESMSAADFKESIRKSEGRVVLGQHLIFAGKGLVRGVTNTELMAAFGADMILLNTYNLDDDKANEGMLGLSIKDLKKRINRPIGMYLGCSQKDERHQALYRLEGSEATPEHVEKAITAGCDFIVIGGNPGTGTHIENIIAATKMAKETAGERILIFSGKWEDGVYEKVIGDPLSKDNAGDIIKALIDAGADVIDLPSPGSRPGISVSMIRELVEYIHSYKPGTLAMTFLNSSVEGADQDTIRLIALKMKETGADIHGIGDGGFSGCTPPENIMQLSVSLKGKPYTFFRMAGVNC